MVAEILSPATVALDRRRKRDLYARHGVMFYWIVDGEARAIEAHQLAGSAYELLGRAVGDVLVADEPLAGLWP